MRNKTEREWIDRPTGTLSASVLPTCANGAARTRGPRSISAARARYSAAA